MKQLLKKLPYWLQSTDQIFQDFADYLQGTKSQNNRRIFIDNSGDVLFVAHVDTVLLPKLKKQTAKRLYATGLDDRLGCLLACKLGLELAADILLTNNEERCASTARFHDCKDYNWIVEFDRADSDVVTYGIDNPEFLQRLSDFWKIGMGSYSDIIDLPTSACCFNLGIGYKHAHGKNSYVNLKTLTRQIVKFKVFYEKYHGEKFIADVKPELPDYHNVDFFTYNNRGEPCDVCGCVDQVEYTHNYYICRSCFSNIISYFFFAEDQTDSTENNVGEILISNRG